LKVITVPSAELHGGGGGALHVIEGAVFVAAEAGASAAASTTIWFVMISGCVRLGTVREVAVLDGPVIGSAGAEVDTFGAGLLQESGTHAHRSNSAWAANECRSLYQDLMHGPQFSATGQSRRIQGVRK
jgi:hypothetical protein